MLQGLSAVVEWRSEWLTLLVCAICGGVLGLLSGLLDADPGEHSQRLGTAWLY